MGAVRPVESRSEKAEQSERPEDHKDTEDEASVCSEGLSTDSDTVEQVAELRQRTQPEQLKQSQHPKAQQAVSKPKAQDTEAAEEEAARARKHAKVAGGRLYAGFCLAYAGAMAASFAGLIPATKLELLTVQDTVETAEFLGRNIWVPAVLAVIYYFTIFGIQDYLKDRKPFDLRYALAAWSMLLAVFSILGSLRTVPVVFEIIRTRGLFHMLCGDTRFDWLVGNPAGWWTKMFIYSKLPELVDTLFIVLRKKKLITLHWYHHITVMLFCWSSLASMCMNGLIFSSMNLTVHAFMYAFYAITALGYRPTQFAIYITFLQILQMVVGTAVSVFISYQENFVEPPVEYSSMFNATWDITTTSELDDGMCKVHPFTATSGTAMYGSYLYLFSSFFYYAYLKPANTKAKAA